MSETVFQILAAIGAVSGVGMFNARAGFFIAWVGALAAIIMLGINGAPA